MAAESSSESAMALAAVAKMKTLLGQTATLFFPCVSLVYRLMMPSLPLSLCQRQMRIEDSRMGRAPLPLSFLCATHTLRLLSIILLKTCSFLSRPPREERSPSHLHTDGMALLSALSNGLPVPSKEVATVRPRPCIALRSAGGRVQTLSCPKQCE